jgi:hypothetical protein
VFACGNVLHVHDLVDYVSQEAAMAGRCAARFVAADKVACDGLRDGKDVDRSGADGGVADGGVAGTDGGAGKAAGVREIPLVAAGGVRYTVPARLSAERMDDKLTVRFRVDNVYRDRYVSVYVGDERLLHRKKRVMAPGEMEEVVLKREDLLARAEADRIVVTLEEE